LKRRGKAAGPPFADAIKSVAIAVPLIAGRLLSPWLEIVADSGGRRRLLLVAASLVRAAASPVVRWVGQADIAAGMALRFVANIGFLLATHSTIRTGSFSPGLATRRRFLGPRGD
jgi:hypothetical protein